MYARIKHSGSRQYLQLVEGRRDDTGKVKQRVVASLGRVDQLKDGSLDALIGGLQKVAGRRTATDSATANLPQFSQALAFGHVYLLHELWQSLGFETALNKALRSSRRQFDATALIRTMVFNRLCDANSKLGVLRWLETVAMPAVPERITHDQLLRSMDCLTDHAAAVETAIAGQLRPLIDDVLSVVFYDLTTVRIHGTGQVENDLRNFGLNKRTGGIARQFVLGMVQTADGLPIAHQVHTGNTSEAGTLLPMIKDVIKRFPIKRVVLIADRGLLSLDNLDAVEGLKTAEGEPLEYILAVPGRRYSDFATIVANTQLKDGRGETRWQERRLVIAHDDERAALQGETRRKKIKAIEAEGDRLAKRLDDTDAGKSLRGRKSNDRRAYTQFSQLVKDAGLSRVLKADLQADLFSFEVDERALHNLEKLDGKLLLVTNTDFTPAEVISRYKSLADIERGFRVLKNDIAIGPVYHRLPERIRAHALICFMALVLYRVMRQKLYASKAGCSPETALRLLETIQQHRVQAGKQQMSGINQPTPEQRDLFEHLGAKMPK